MWCRYMGGWNFYGDFLQKAENASFDFDAKDECGRTPLFLAAKNGHATIVRLLLDTRRVDIDVKVDSSHTPLSSAAENGHEAVVQLLLDTGKVDINTKDEYGHTAVVFG